MSPLLVAAVLFANQSFAADGPFTVDYKAFESPTWSGQSLECKRDKRGLRCRSSASNRRTAWPAFGPVAGKIDGSYTIDAVVSMKWGGASGIAFGFEPQDGTWSGVLIRQDTEVWAGAYDGKDWVAGVDWTPLVRSGPGAHALHIEVDGQQVTVTVDGRSLGTYTSAQPLAGEVYPLVFDDADVTFVSLFVTRRP